jgi:hypothetical protein
VQLLRFGDGHCPVASPVCVTVGRLLTLEVGRARVTLRLGGDRGPPRRLLWLLSSKVCCAGPRQG